MLSGKLRRSLEIELKCAVPRVYHARDPATSRAAATWRRTRTGRTSGLVYVCIRKPGQKTAAASRVALRRRCYEHRRACVLPSYRYRRRSHVCIHTGTDAARGTRHAGHGGRDHVTSSRLVLGSSWRRWRRGQPSALRCRWDLGSTSPPCSASSSTSSARVPQQSSA